MALISIKNEYLISLRKSKEEETLTFFVGSGFSRSRDPENYVGWENLAKKIKKELSDGIEGDFLKIAQIYEANNGRDQLLKIVEDSFFKEDVPDELHKALIKTDVHNIITTNWDCLIENAARENLSLYDTIASDEELLQSKHNNRILKIHGDFKHKNIVFSEQDYLNYSDNFPILENYVKNIVATNTLVLLGYSFNDLDLKQLVNWINKKIEKCSIFMITTTSKAIDEIKYFENTFGIRIIQICDNNKESKKAFISFFNCLDYEKYIPQLESPALYVYRHLKPYENYPVILRQFIQKGLSNCSFVYDSNQESILELNHEIITIDMNYEKRDVYKEFYDSIQNLISKKDDDLAKIIKILQKADIQGIATDDERSTFLRISSKIGNADFYNEAFDFSYKLYESESIEEKMKSVFSLYSLERFEEAYKLNKEILKETKFMEDFANYFISLFNNNSILFSLKYSLNCGLDINKKYRNINEISIQNEYIKLSSVQRKLIQQIFEFTSLSTLNGLFNRTRKELENINENKKIIADGGIAYSSESGHRTNHKNLVDFVINSCVCIENYAIYKECCHNYIDMYFANSNTRVYNPNKTELYSLIRYYDNKALVSKLSIFAKKDSFYKIVINNKLHKWLIDKVLVNTINNYINKSNPFTNLEKTINNSIYLLSLIKNSKKQTEKILFQIKNLIINARNNSNLFEILNTFFVNQYILYKGTYIKGQPAINIFETLIQKFVDDKCNLHEIESLLSCKLISVCNIGILKSTKFKNQALLKKLLCKTDEMKSNCDKYRLIENLIMIIYQMSDDVCKYLIRDFVDKLDIKQNKISAEYCSFMLALKSLKFDIKNEYIINLIKEYLSTIPDNTFSLNIYGIQGKLHLLLKKYKLYYEISATVDSIIKEFEKNKKELFSKISN